MDISQHNLDRILVFDIQRGTERRRLIIEIFGKGNLTIVTEDGLIKYSTTYLKMKDRDILANKPYQFPPSRGANIFNLTEKNLQDILSKQEDAELHQILADELDLSPQYAQELCIRAKIDPHQIATSLKTRDQQNLFQVITDLIVNLNQKQYKPTLYHTKEKIIDATPFPMQIMETQDSDLQVTHFDSYNEAVDELFVTKDSVKLQQRIEKVKKNSLKQGKKETKRKKRSLEKQEQALAKLEKKRDRCQKWGNLVFQQLPIVTELLNTIMNARKQGTQWPTITRTLRKAKKDGLPGAQIYQKIDPKNAALIVEIEGEEITLDIRLEATENAQQFFKDSKKAGSKVKGALLAIQKHTLSQEVIHEAQDPILESSMKLFKKPKKQWYEKFRWFLSSNNLLIIAGRDQKTNDMLVAKHLETTDLFMHAEIKGAPVAIIKEGVKKATKKTLREAASFAASFSNAWKSNVGGLDVFYVKSDQVSKSPPSGQYLAKGSYIISGKRQIIKGAKLELTLGYMMSSEITLKSTPDQSKTAQKMLGYFIIGPEDAIKKQSKYYVHMVPGNLKSSDLAKQLRSQLRQKIPKEEIPIFNQISLDDLIRIIPSSGGNLTPETK
jgi:predicted ribosome quality control (RQC) complex YloA/Tae2 family protein